MKLASVLALKAELFEAPIAPVHVARLLASSSRAAAFATDLHVGPPQTVKLALGVASGRGRGDYYLGVRVLVGGTTGLRLADSIRQQTRGESDVRVVPRIAKRPGPSASWFRARRRPLEAGLSVGHFRITAGTLGAVVEDADSYYVLSNNHVLADVNAGSPGDAVLQPGRADRTPSASTLIGVLDRYVPISFLRSNVVDCAVATLSASMEFYEGWNAARPGRITGVAPIGTDDLGREVRKVGRTTGITRGRITQVEIDRLRINMGTEANPRIASFSDQFEVAGTGSKPFSQPGDSGSLIIDAAGKALGLLFAGGPDENGVDLTYANRIERVLQKLGVSLTF